MLIVWKEQAHETAVVDSSDMENQRRTDKIAIGKQRVFSNKNANKHASQSQERTHQQRHKWGTLPKKNPGGSPHQLVDV